MIPTIVIGDAGAGIAAGFGIIWILISLAIFVFWIWMLIDCLTTPMDSGEKILWFLVIFFLPFIGSLIYFLVKRGGKSAIV